MSNPFLITGPAIVSVSGGRTSGYMLWRILQAHGGTLPADVHAVFANTGREMPATLDFVRDMQAAWNVPITWLEYRRAPGKITAEEVNHNSASRNGEPFEALVNAMASLPTPARRSCTTQLKVYTIKRWCKAQGWKHWTNVVGMRADEPRRVANVTARKGEPWTNLMPMAAAGVTVLDVAQFWKTQPFDLHLAGKWEGNCDGCFMKSRAQLARMFRDHPEQMIWWENIEQVQRGARGLVRKFHKPDFRPNYAAMADAVAASPMLPFDETMIEGGELCDAGCGI